MKAGGIDLLDLMKENLLAPAKVVSLKDVPGPRRDRRGAGGGLRIGADGHAWPSSPINPCCDSAIPPSPMRSQGSASPQIRNVATLGGNLLQRPRCWYFRAAEYHCLRKGGGHCFAISGENQYHAIFDNRLCAIVHPSTRRHRAGRVGRDGRARQRRGRRAPSLARRFLRAAGQDVQRENDLKPQEILTAILLPPLPASTRMAHLKQGEKDSFDWPLADVAVVLDLAPNGDCKRAAIILGAAAPVPHRAKTAEAVLAARRIDENAAREAGRAALDGATPLAKNAYKLPLFETLVRRAILKAVGVG